MNISDHLTHLAVFYHKEAQRCSNVRKLNPQKAEGLSPEQCRDHEEV